MGWINISGVSTGKDRLFEVRKLLTSGPHPVVESGETDALAGECRTQLGDPAAIHLAADFVAEALHVDHLFADGEAVDGGRTRVGFLDPAQEADALGVELVHVACRDREELDAFEEPIARVLRFGKNTAVEFEEA